MILCVVLTNTTMFMYRLTIYSAFKIPDKFV